MKGLLMADVKVIKAMDNTIDGSSKIIPASINKSGEIGAYTSGATEKQLKLLRKYIRGLLKKIGSEIASGNVDIKPYRKKSLTACTYCSFHSVCQFDTSRKENSYKLLLDKTNQEVWERLEEEKYE
jgi:ATP-dependent helicase/nuclease subunit B